MQRISTPDGRVPKSQNPVEGVDYTVLAGDPVDGDMVRDGTRFYEFRSRRDLDGVGGGASTLQQILARLDAIETALNV